MPTRLIVDGRGLGGRGGEPTTASGAAMSPTRSPLRPSGAEDGRMTQMEPFGGWVICDTLTRRFTASTPMRVALMNVALPPGAQRGRRPALPHTSRKNS